MLGKIVGMFRNVELEGSASSIKWLKKTWGIGYVKNSLKHSYCSSASRLLGIVETDKWKSNVRFRDFYAIAPS